MSWSVLESFLTSPALLPSLTLRSKDWCKLPLRTWSLPDTCFCISFEISSERSRKCFSFTNQMPFIWLVGRFFSITIWSCAPVKPWTWRQRRCLHAKGVSHRQERHKWSFLVTAHNFKNKSASEQLRRIRGQPRIRDLMPPPSPTPRSPVDLSLPLQHCRETGGCSELTYLRAQECWLAASVPPSILLA